MEWQGWFTLGVVLVALAAMVREIAAPDIVMMAALFALAAAGILTPIETFSGFANPAVATIGALFMVSAALRETGALDMTLGRFLGRARQMTGGLVRICLPVGAVSAFLNNAPIVAMMTPSVIDWARRRSLAPSRFLIPLSYASILGSCTTMIGTSVNLTVAGLIIEANMSPMTFFELLPVGLPICAVGFLYLILLAPRRLPDRLDPTEALGEHRREYTAAMRVEPDYPHIGQSVERAGLRELAGLFLVEIDRQGRVITPVGPDESIRAGDRLVFAGVVSTIVDLQRVRGLVPDSDDAAAPQTGPSQRLIEAVVSSSSPLVGQSIRDSNFRTVYDAAVIGVHRNGERVPGKIGEIVLRPGDTLLMQSAIGFMRAHRNSPDFYLVSELEGAHKPRFERAWLSLGTLVAMVTAVSLGVLPISIAVFLAAGFLVLTRCIRGPQARRSVDWSILVVIGAGLGVASAMENTGAARYLADLLLGAVGDMGPIAVLAGIYILAALITQPMSNAAAIVLVVPIALDTALSLGANHLTFTLAVVIGAATSFLTPVGHKANVLVFGPGGYKFFDYARVGAPLTLFIFIATMIALPRLFPLFP